MTERHPTMAQSYEVASIRRSNPPANAEGTGWHCYVIKQGDNAIQGYRQGSLNVVTEAVDEIVAGLNERRLARPGRPHQAAAKKKKKAPKAS